MTCELFQNELSLKLTVVHLESPNGDDPARQVFLYFHDYVLVGILTEDDGPYEDGLIAGWSIPKGAMERLKQRMGGNPKPSNSEELEGSVNVALGYVLGEKFAASSNAAVALIPANRGLLHAINLDD